MIGRQQQLLRIDFETAPSHEVLAAKLADYERLLADADVVVLSDYGKGGLAHIATMIERARARGQAACSSIPRATTGRATAARRCSRPTAASSARSSGRWKRRGATSRARAQALRSDLDVDALLVTRSEEGMSLFTATGALTIPAQAREVYDVSGAGDTVIATLGALLAAGASLPDAVRIANEAAGVVVGKLGTAVVAPGELVRSHGAAW